MTENIYGPHIHWLRDEEYQKLIGQLNLQYTAVFRPFNYYGLDIFVPQAVRECVKLAEDFGLRVRGVDRVIDIDRIRYRLNGR